MPPCLRQSHGLRRLALLLAAAIALPAAAEEPSPLADDAARMLADIRTLASPEMGGRDPDEGKSAAWVAERMEAIGLEPLFDGDYRQPIPGGKVPLTGANVGGFVRGGDPEVADEWVLITAHHDHLGQRGERLFAGADDNASGTAMVLEAARRLVADAERGIRPRRSVALVCFDLEEHMLWGSRWFVSHAPMELGSIRLFITADMIGRRLGDLDGIDEVFVMGTESAAGLGSIVRRSAERAGQPLAVLGTDIVGTRSDYGPFKWKRVPFLFFSTGEHNDYHTPRDVPAKIDAARAARIKDVVLATALEAASSDEPPTWSPQPPDALAEAAALNRIATLVLDEHAETGQTLSLVEQLLVERMKTETAAAIEAGQVTPRQRTWLVNGARAMLLTVF